MTLHLQCLPARGRPRFSGGSLGRGTEDPGAAGRSPPGVLQGKEIIEYYLRQLEEEGITFVPRWTPPSATPSADTLSSRTPAVAAAAVTPDAALKEGLCSEASSTPGGGPETPAGTPDGKAEAAAFLGWACPATP